MELPIALSKLQNNYIKRLQEFLRILITSTITPIRQNAMKILCLIFFFHRFHITWKLLLRFPYKVLKVSMLKCHKCIRKTNSCQWSAPRYLPTTQISATLYSCCSKFPNINDMAKSNKLTVIGPFIKFRYIFVSLLS